MKTYEPPATTSLIPSAAIITDIWVNTQIQKVHSPLSYVRIHIRHKMLEVSDVYKNVGGYASF